MSTFCYDKNVPYFLVDHRSRLAHSFTLDYVPMKLPVFMFSDTYFSVYVSEMLMKRVQSLCEWRIRNKNDITLNLNWLLASIGWVAKKLYEHNKHPTEMNRDKKEQIFFLNKNGQNPWKRNSKASLRFPNRNWFHLTKIDSEFEVHLWHWTTEEKMNSNGNWFNWHDLLSNFIFFISIFIANSFVSTKLRFDIWFMCMAPLCAKKGNFSMLCKGFTQLWIKSRIFFLFLFFSVITSKSWTASILMASTDLLTFFMCRETHFLWFIEPIRMHAPLGFYKLDIYLYNWKREREGKKV